MKDLQKAIEEIVIKWGEGIMSDADARDCVKELTQLITSREQEIKREAVLEFIQFYFDNPEIEDVDDVVNKFLAQQKENK